MKRRQNKSDCHLHHRRTSRQKREEIQLTGKDSSIRATSQSRRLPTRMRDPPSAEPAASFVVEAYATGTKRSSALVTSRSESQTPVAGTASMFRNRKELADRRGHFRDPRTGDLDGRDAQFARAVEDSLEATDRCLEEAAPKKRKGTKLACREADSANRRGARSRRAFHAPDVAPDAPAPWGNRFRIESRTHRNSGGARGPVVTAPAVGPAVRSETDDRSRQDAGAAKERVEPGEGSRSAQRKDRNAYAFHHRPAEAGSGDHRSDREGAARTEGCAHHIAHALPGRYVVFMPSVNHLGVSRKIASDEERQRLKRILQDASRRARPAASSSARRARAFPKTRSPPT